MTKEPLPISSRSVCRIVKKAEIKGSGWHGIAVSMMACGPEDWGSNPPSCKCT